MPRLRLAAATAAVCLALVGCSGSADPVASDEPSTPATSAAPEPTASEAPAESVAECTDVLLDPASTVAGDALGGCVAAAMVAVGTGTQRVDSSDGQSTVVDFQWDPDFSMHAASDDIGIVIDGDRGWALVDGAWVEGDAGSSDGATAMAGILVEATRAASDPATIAGLLSTSPTWTVQDQQAVPVGDSVAESAWLLTPDAPMSMLGVTLTDVQLWLTDAHLGAYFVGTGSVSGVTVTTSNTFLQWGGPVDIPQLG
ncbi:hypothetical protein [Agrococcus jejuensis]|uniref:Lipoprotein LprG n=1 Tax=Agrococcus jejuensis TaxID=399736 RepID=A0A1G8AWK8_9MICO|nr:hypothetical protein [Agrococcus jejuensis]SDH25166.1 hypothetical protein SAMN04489720_0556 [Agrococcus jejuensis]